MHDDDDAAEHMEEVAERLRAGRIHLHRTVRDLRNKRRTPDQREDLRHRARALVYRSELIRRKITRLWNVH